MAKAKDLFRRVQKSKSNEELIAQIDEQLKRNKGGFSAIGFDTDSSFTPYRISDVKVENPYGTQSRLQTPALQPLDFEYTPIEVPEFELPQPEEPTQQPTESLATQFIQSFNQSVQGQSQQEKEAIYQQTGVPYSIYEMEDGGILGIDGVIRYSDGTVRQYITNSGYPIACGLNGEVIYSDGSRRQQPSNSSQFITQENISYVDGGMQGLVSGLFGSSATITQQYGNYNPSLGYQTGYHKGTDFVPSSSSLSLPVDAQVVQVFQDDGTRWGDFSGHQGYGNSVLVRLSTGEMLRFSHLADAVGYQPGQVIMAGSVFGRVGSTGNSTGNHLDLEVYNAQGQIIDPRQFSGFGANNPFKQEAVSNLKTIFNERVQGTEKYSSKLNQEPQQTPQEPQASSIIKPEYQNTTISQAPNFIEDTKKTLQTAGSLVKQDIANVGQVLGTSIERANPTGEFDLGISETLKGDPQSGREALSGTFERSTENIPTRGRFDLGISEALRGDMEGSRAVREATRGNIEQKIQSGVGNLAGYVDEFLSRLRNSNLPQPGEILGARTAYAAESRPSMADINSEYGLKIGDSPTNEVGSSAQPALRMGESRQQRYADGSSDIRDDFFKSGQFNKFSSFLKPNADQVSGGALDTSVFNPNFFERRNAMGDIQSVFGGTAQLNSAIQKFEQYRKSENEKAIAEFMRLYAGNEGYDQGSVNSILAQLKGNSGFIDNLPEPLRVQRQDHGSSSPQPQAQVSSDAKLSYPSGTSFSGPQQPSPNSLYVAGNTQPNNLQKQAQQGFTVNLSNLNTDTTSAVRGDIFKQESIFDKAKNLFRRIF